MRRVLLAFALTGLFAAAGYADDEGDKKDLALMQGKWTVVSMEDDGVKVEEAANATVTVDGDRVQFKQTDEEHKSLIKLDAGKNPKEIDVTVATDPGKVRKGIYSVTKKELKICLVKSPDKNRPTAFESKEGSEMILMKLKRAN
jgi:uncharacterized protein (TIGR03067 family)